MSNPQDSITISQIEQDIYSTYALIYENTDLLEQTEDYEYRQFLINHINKLKHQLKYYKQIKYSQLTGYSKDIICYDEAKEIDVEVYKTLGKANY